MPSIKDFKTKFTSKSKKNKAQGQTMQPQMPPAPAQSQTPPTQKRLGRTAPGQVEGRSSAPPALRLSASLRSLPTSRSTSLKVDEHRQLKEQDRPEDPENSSDPDTSLFEYEDDKELTTTLKRSLSMRYGSNGHLHTANSSESIDTIGMSHGVTSPSNEEVIEDVVVPQTGVSQRSNPGILRHSLQLTIPRSDSPLHSMRGSLHTSLPRTSILAASQTESLRNSLDASAKSKAEQDVTLRQSIEKVEFDLHERVNDLAQLTLKEKPKAISESDQLDYYKKLESSTEHTLRDQEELIRKLRARIEHLESSLADFKKYRECTEKEITDLSESLKSQNKNLENLVYKLNQEVSYCQTHHQLVKDPNGNRVRGLPDDAPTPAWMVDFKYLSPLIKSLEDQVAMKSQELSSLKRKFAKYEADIRSLTTENENLRDALKAGGSDPESIEKKTWSQLQKQALLVLEENEILLKELDVQDEKVSQVHEKHYYELTQLEDKVRKVEIERQSVLERLTDTKCQLEVAKSRCTELSASMALKVDRDEHNRVLIEYKTKLEQFKEDQEREKDSFLAKLGDSKSESDKTEKVLGLLSDELKECKQELRRKDKSISMLEEDCSALTKEVKKGRDIMANLLLVTDEAVNERQAMKHFLQCENKGKKKSAGVIIESEIVKEKLLGSFKRYKLKAEEQMDKLMAKLEKQADEFDIERREYERQIKHLRLMVHEKDGDVQAASRDKKDVEECLEFVWKATQSDTHSMNESLRKNLRESRERHLHKFFMNDSGTDVLHMSE